MTIRKGKSTISLKKQRMPIQTTRRKVKKIPEEIIRSNKFKKWFGNWEDEPENASKVVDKWGKPKVVFHGTTFDFDSFSAEKSTTGVDGLGFYFTSSPADADTYKYNLVELHPSRESAIRDLHRKWEKTGDPRGKIDLFDPLLVREAYKELGIKPQTYNVYLAINNPVFVDGKRFDKEGTEFISISDPDNPKKQKKGTTGQKLISALKSKAMREKYDYRLTREKGNWQSRTIFDNLNLPKNGSFDITASRLQENIWQNLYLGYDDAERNLKAEFISDLYKKMGYDGIIHLNADNDLILNNEQKREALQSLPDGEDSVTHYIIFKPEQVKLTTAKQFKKSSPKLSEGALKNK